jgi:hypothetical protein
MSFEQDSDFNQIDRTLETALLIEKAISDGYFTSTSENFDGDMDLEADARMAYYDWCESNNRVSIDHDDDECYVACMPHGPLSPASIAQLRDLTSEYGLKIGGQPEGESPYIHIDLYQKAQAYSTCLLNEWEFLSRLVAILSDPGSFQPSPA